MGFFVLVFFGPRAVWRVGGGGGVGWCAGQGCGSALLAHHLKFYIYIDINNSEVTWTVLKILVPLHRIACGSHLSLVKMNVKTTAVVGNRTTNPI